MSEALNRDVAREVPVEQIKQEWRKLEINETHPRLYMLPDNAQSIPRVEAWGEFQPRLASFTFFRDQAGAYLVEVDTGNDLFNMTYGDFDDMLREEKVRSLRRVPLNTQHVTESVPLRDHQIIEAVIRSKEDDDGQVDGIKRQLSGDRPKRTERKLLSLEEMISSKTLRSSLLNQATYYARGNHSEAEDLVQDTLLRAHQVNDRFVPESNYKTRIYLANILRNRFISKFRQEMTAEKTREVIKHNMYASLPLHKLAPQEAVLILQDVQRILHNMESERSGALLLALEGFSYEEMANMLGVAEGTVKSRVHRAKKELETMLSDSTQDIEKWLIKACSYLH